MANRDLIQRTLEQYFPYCKVLDLHAKERFYGRVSLFLQGKKFLHRGSLSLVTEEMKIIAAAHYCWLSRGFPEQVLDNFETILFYPEQFDSGLSEMLVDAEAHPSGVVALGWKELAFGCLKPEDGYNAGFRVFAEAMAMQNASSSEAESGFFDEQDFDHFTSIADRYFEMICAGNAPEILMSKGVEMRFQMFGCTVELLMERPAAFRELCPDLYKALTRLLCIS